MNNSEVTVPRHLLSARPFPDVLVSCRSCSRCLDSVQSKLQKFIIRQKFYIFISTLALLLEEGKGEPQNVVSKLMGFLLGFPYYAIFSKCCMLSTSVVRFGEMWAHTKRCMSVQAAQSSNSFANMIFFNTLFLKREKKEAQI